ncbi:hypothetical protein CRE_28171 [Caenorhabditis remanei]|uniref:Uncharacterized protein n=2 Tax=Caenorhabditis remanei TaxID=31234 RepID=E3LMQ0_CAERE|nr:hypothetical protein CRE_28171 [Caenorhabditis remanei]
MGFFSHAAMLGVGYFIGKSYCFRYRVHQLPNEPDASEISFRVERKEGPMIWGNPWWNHHYHHCHPHHHQQNNQKNGAEAQQVSPQQKKNSELLEVEASQ